MDATFSDLLSEKQKADAGLILHSAWRHIELRPAPTAEAITAREAAKAAAAVKVPEAEGGADADSVKAEEAEAEAASSGPVFEPRALEGNH
eukprot:3458227-Prorocentrum_lima.AAC.1